MAEIDYGRLGRLYALAAVVTTAFLVTAAVRLDSTLFSIAVVAIGAIAFVTAMLGVLIAGATALDTT